ncbi:MAG: thioesterase family protein [SAR324 cluster bacterium]
MQRTRLDILREVCDERIAFNKVLGLKLVEASGGKSRLEFAFKEELVGNFMLHILHGGVICSALDVAGGLAVLASFKEDDPLYPMGTVDLRVDFLRPGKGERFVATGQVMRPGRILCATRMELVNETGDLLAMGQAVYRFTAKDGFRQ